MIHGTLRKNRLLQTMHPVLQRSLLVPVLIRLILQGPSLPMQAQLVLDVPIRLGLSQRMLALVMMLQLCLSSSAILFRLVTSCVLSSTWCSSSNQVLVNRGSGEETQQAQQQGAPATQAQTGGRGSQGNSDLEKGSLCITHGAAEASALRYRCLLGFILEFISQSILSANTTVASPG